MSAPEMTAAPAVLSADEVARRRRSAARLGWLLAAAVAVIYGLGFLIPR